MSMISTGLIGYTGFVGQNLQNSSPGFDKLYNTRNIKSIQGQDFGLLVCAAPQAKKWWANQNPDADLSIIEGLIETIQKTYAERFVLVSTIDVFPTVKNADETFECESIDNHSYGSHRFMLEKAAVEHFSKCHIVRLPALFGPGLKKNIIFDLINHNQVDKINPNSQFQWYDINDLWSDIQVIIKDEIPLVALATEPIRTDEIHDRFFPEIVIGNEASVAAIYDIKTRYARHFGSPSAYVRSKQEIMKKLEHFVTSEMGSIQ